MHQDITAAIRKCHLFAGADDASVTALARASRFVRFRSRQVMFMAGDPPDGLYVLQSGLVRIWIADEDGRELTIALMEPGDPFGEIALLDGLPRTANATALEPTQCLVTPPSALDAALEGNLTLARHLIDLLCEHLRRNTQEMGAFAFLDLDSRLAQKLHDLAVTHGEIDGRAARFTRKFSQSDLAQMLGVTREAVNKRLGAFAHDGLIRRDGGETTVPDLSALAARARAGEGLIRRGA
ncbi:MAG: Crp/Fnr family transcriptional regulator [Maritimibacter sp.]|nr:Crp/Fnr family transcriptional regulator [Maritimibacter sp.]